MPESVNTCPACAGTDLEPVAAGLYPSRYTPSESPFGLVRCTGCGLVCLSPRPTPAEVGAFYPKSFYAHLTDRATEGDTSLRAKLRQHRPYAPGLRRRVKLEIVEKVCGQRPGRVLDVGAGDGDFLARMKARGWSVEGTDFSEESARLVSEALGSPIHVGPFEELELLEHRFELVTLWDVLEHLYRPIEAMRKARALLAEGGALVISVPNYGSLEARTLGTRWPHLDVPRHLLHFTHDSLRTLLTRAGFAQIEVTTAHAILVPHLMRGFLPDLPGVERAREQTPPRLRALVGDVVQTGLLPLNRVLNRLELGAALVAVARA